MRLGWALPVAELMLLSFLAAAWPLAAVAALDDLVNCFLLKDLNRVVCWLWLACADCFALAGFFPEVSCGSVVFLACFALRVEPFFS